MMSLQRGSETFMVTLADLTPRRDPIAWAAAQLDTQGVLIRRFFARRADAAFWTAWLLGLAAFIALAVWCTRSYALPLDATLTRWVQDLDRFPRIDRLFSTVNDFGEYGFIGGVLIGLVIIFLLRGLRVEALMMAGAGATHYVQLGVRRLVERPFSLEDPPWIAHAGWGLRQFPGPEGYPSGHVFGEMIVYGLVILYAGRLIPYRPAAWALRAVCAAEILLGGPARMYTGAHFPSDVLGAMLLAALYLALAWRVDRAVTHIRAVTAERKLAAEAGLSGPLPRAVRLRRPARAAVPEEREPARTR